MNAEENVVVVQEEMVDVDMEVEKEKDVEKEIEVEVPVEEPSEEPVVEEEEKEVKKEVDLKDICFGFLTEKKEKEKEITEIPSPLEKSEEIDDIKIEDTQKQSWLYNFCSCSLNIYCCIR